MPTAFLLLILADNFKLYKMRKTLILITLCVLGFCTAARADGGMWLVNDINPQLYGLMRKAGIKITPAQIYSDAKYQQPGIYKRGTSLKDAVVALNGGECSGSIISPDGLMITNHHCAYSDIHALSTPEHNYLENGYWALKRSDEMPIKGKTITFLCTVLDVTDECMAIVDSMDCHGGRGFRYLTKVQRRLLAKLGKDEEAKKYDFDLQSEWAGQKYYLYISQTYGDVRFVGAPPVTVAAFGNDADNWGWPQHKCDFAMYRIYTAPDGSPAEYSPDNVPMKTTAYLKVSAAGVKEGDYTMVMGYPGRTSRYVSSPELEFHYAVENPITYVIRRTKLDVIKKFMDKDPLLRLKYSNEYFEISNYCDYAKWQNICIGKQGTIDTIKVREAKLKQWINADPQRVKDYGNVLEGLQKTYSSVKDISRNRQMLMEALVRGCAPVTYSTRLATVVKKMEKKQLTAEDTSDRDVRGILNTTLKQERETDPAVEQEITYAMLKYIDEHVDRKYMNNELRKFLDDNKDNLENKIKEMYANSIFSDSAKTIKFFASGITMEKVKNEPFAVFESFVNSTELGKEANKTLAAEKLNPTTLNRAYIGATYMMLKDRGVAQAPDANSTMRITFGNVASIAPADGVYYSWQSTAAGIEQKRDTTNYDFNMYPAVYSLIKNKNFGQWTSTMSGNTIPVDFISTCDITGGNSGSPVMNANGELIGLAFDGNRDGIADEFFFNNKYCRCVNLDIRYVLWFLDKYAHADTLLKEMGVTGNSAKPVAKLSGKKKK